MSAHPAPLRVLPPRHDDGDESLFAPEFATPEFAAARYVDREIGEARTTATLCTRVAGRARSEGRCVVAGVLGEFAAELREETAMLSLVSLPDVHWPRRERRQVGRDADLDEWIQRIGDSLQQSERTLRWVASRPDLPPLARTTFHALATTRRARRHLLLACSVIDA